jgi:hypothetical protein
MTDTQDFKGIDAAKWEQIKAAIFTKVGITITSDIGEQTKDGIELSWSYNAANLDLTVTLVKREFFDPSAQIIDTDIATLVANA